MRFLVLHLKSKNKLAVMLVRNQFSCGLTVDVCDNSLIAGVVANSGSVSSGSYLPRLSVKWDPLVETANNANAVYIDGINYRNIKYRNTTAI